MPAEPEVSRHYTHGNLMEAIRTGLAALGKLTSSLASSSAADSDDISSLARSVS